MALSFPSSLSSHTYASLFLLVSILPFFLPFLFLCVPLLLLFLAPVSCFLLLILLFYKVSFRCRGYKGNDVFASIQETASSEPSRTEEYSEIKTKNDVLPANGGLDVVNVHSLPHYKDVEQLDKPQHDILETAQQVDITQEEDTNEHSLFYVEATSLQTYGHVHVSSAKNERECASDVQQDTLEAAQQETLDVQQDTSECTSDVQQVQQDTSEVVDNMNKQDEDISGHLRESFHKGKDQECTQLDTTEVMQAAHILDHFQDPFVGTSGKQRCMLDEPQQAMFKIAEDDNVEEEKQKHSLLHAGAPEIEIETWLPRSHQHESLIETIHQSGPSWEPFGVDDTRHSFAPEYETFALDAAEQAPVGIAFEEEDEKCDRFPMETRSPSMRPNEEALPTIEDKDFPAKYLELRIEQDALFSTEPVAASEKEIQEGESSYKLRDESAGCRIGAYNAKEAQDDTLISIIGPGKEKCEIESEEIEGGFGSESRSGSAQSPQMLNEDAILQDKKHEEEKLLADINAIKKIVGYCGECHASIMEQIRALFMFLGMEPLSWAAEGNDFERARTEIELLKVVVGVK